MARRSPVSVILVLLILVAFFAGLALMLRGAAAKRTLLAAKERVGVVEISGPLTESKTILRHLKKFREDDSIKAIVVRINSPGGAVGPAQEIREELLKLRDQKKVVASLGTVAASGGLLHRLRGRSHRGQPRDPHRQHRGDHEPGQCAATAAQTGTGGL